MCEEIINLQSVTNANSDNLRTSGKKIRWQGIFCSALKIVFMHIGIHYGKQTKIGVVRIFSYFMFFRVSLLARWCKMYISPPMGSVQLLLPSSQFLISLHMQWVSKRWQHLKHLPVNIWLDKIISFMCSSFNFINKPIAFNSGIKFQLDNLVLFHHFISQ